MNILPSYKCNFQCPFCNIPKLDKGEILNLNWLENTLGNLPSMDEIHILGGEPTLLPLDYQDRLINICSNKINGNKPKIYTNLSTIPVFADRLNIMVSYDPCNRQSQNKVLSNMLQLDKFQINMIVTKTLIEDYGTKIFAMVRNLHMISSIRLSSYTHFNGLEDFTPDPQKLLEFISFIIRNNDNDKISFYPIDSIKNNYIKDDPPNT